MDIQETKGLLQSKTIWGIIIMIAGFAGSKLGVDITEADVKDVLDTGCMIAEGIGVLLATYGRVVATKEIAK